jgi:hypothetical protein
MLLFEKCLRASVIRKSNKADSNFIHYTTVHNLIVKFSDIEDKTMRKLERMGTTGTGMYI